jgi:hypothetical protein
MLGNVRIQLPLEPRQKFHLRIFAKIFVKIQKFLQKYENFRKNTKIFAQMQKFLQE